MRIGARLILSAFPVAAILFLPATAWAWPRPETGDPFSMTTGKISCRSGTVRVTLRNQTRQPARFDLRADSAHVATGAIPARRAVVRHVKIRRGGSAEIEAYAVTDSRTDTLVESTRVRNDCHWGHHRDRLPLTGPPIDLMAKLATAGGLVVTGGIVWWYGSIWPRSKPPSEL